MERLINGLNTAIITLAEGVTYDFSKAELQIGEQCDKLSMLESKVFIVLCKNKNKLSKRDLLLQAGWNSTEIHLELQLNKVICKLRQLLKRTEKVEIVLNKGNGYWLKTLKDKK